MTQRATIKLGTVICDTMRQEDLMPAFTAVLEDIAQPDDVAAHKAIRAARSIGRGRREYGYNTFLADMTMEALCDALNEYAGEDRYFGAHPDDGSDYGFWACVHLAE